MKAGKRDENSNIHPIHLIDHSFVSRLIGRYNWSINNGAPRSTLQFHKEGQASQIQMVELSPRIEIKQYIQPLHVQLIYNSAQLLSLMQARVKALTSLLEQTQDIVKQEVVQSYRPNEPARRVINLPNSSENGDVRQSQLQSKPLTVDGRRYIQAPQRHEVAPYSVNYPLLHRMEQSRVTNWQLSANQQLMNKLSQRDWSVNLEQLLNNGQSGVTESDAVSSQSSSSGKSSTKRKVENNKSKVVAKANERAQNIEGSPSVVVSRNVPRATVEMSWSKSVQQQIEEQRAIELVANAAAQATQNSEAEASVRGNRGSNQKDEQLDGQTIVVRGNTVQRKRAVLQSQTQRINSLAVNSNQASSAQGSAQGINSHGIQTSVQKQVIGQLGLQSAGSVKQMLRSFQASLQQGQQQLVIKRQDLGPLQLSYRIIEGLNSLHERKVSSIHQRVVTDSNRSAVADNVGSNQGNSKSSSVKSKARRDVVQTTSIEQVKSRAESTEIRSNDNRSNDNRSNERSSSRSSGSEREISESKKTEGSGTESSRPKFHEFVKLAGIRPLQRKQSKIIDDAEAKQLIQQSNQTEAETGNIRTQEVVKQSQTISNSKSDHALHSILPAPISTSIANIAKLRSWQRKLNEQGETVVSQWSKVEQSSASSTMNIRLIHRKLTEQEQQQTAAFLLRRSEEQRVYKEQVKQSKTEQSRKQNNEQAKAPLNIRKAVIIAAASKEQSSSHTIQPYSSAGVHLQQETKQESITPSETRYKRLKHEVLSNYITSSKGLVERIQRQYNEAKQRQDVIVYNSQPASFQLLGNSRKITVLDIAPLRLIGLTRSSGDGEVQALIADGQGSAGLRSASQTIVKRLTLVDPPVQLVARAQRSSSEGSALQATRATWQSNQANQANQANQGAPNLVFQDDRASQAKRPDGAEVQGASQAGIQSSRSTVLQRQQLQERKPIKLYYRPMAIAAAQQELASSLNNSLASQPVQRLLVRMRMLQTYATSSPTMLQGIPLLHRQGNGQLEDELQKRTNVMMQQQAHGANAMRHGDAGQAGQPKLNAGQPPAEVSIKLEHVMHMIKLTPRLANIMQQPGGIKRFAEYVIKRTLPSLTSNAAKEIARKVTARKAITPLNVRAADTSVLPKLTTGDAQQQMHAERIAGINSSLEYIVNQGDTRQSEAEQAAIQSTTTSNVSQAVLQHRAGMLGASIMGKQLQRHKSSRPIGLLHRGVNSQSGAQRNGINSQTAMSQPNLTTVSANTDVQLSLSQRPGEPVVLQQSLGSFEPITLRTSEQAKQSIMVNKAQPLATTSGSLASAKLEITERRQPPTRLDVKKEAVVQAVPENVQQLQQTVQRLEQQLQEQQAVLYKQEKQVNTRQLVDQLYDELSRKMRMEAKRFGR